MTLTNKKFKLLDRSYPRLEDRQNDGLTKQKNPAKPATMDAIANRPPWVTPQIKSAPKIRQIYWCDYWKDARLPEMWKTRPVIVISYKNTLTGPCLVVPVSTEPQDKNRWAYRLSIEIEGNGVTSWAVCNQPSTVSPSRFSQFRGTIPILPKEDFNQVLERLTEWLPQPFVLDDH